MKNIELKKHHRILASIIVLLLYSYNGHTQDYQLNPGCQLFAVETVGLSALSDNNPETIYKISKDLSYKYWLHLEFTEPTDLDGLNIEFPIGSPYSGEIRWITDMGHDDASAFTKTTAVSIDLFLDNVSSAVLQFEAPIHSEELLVSELSLRQNGKTDAMILSVKQNLEKKIGKINRKNLIEIESEMDRYANQLGPYSDNYHELLKKMIYEIQPAVYSSEELRDKTSDIHHRSSALSTAFFYRDVNKAYLQAYLSRYKYYAVNGPTSVEYLGLINKFKWGYSKENKYYPGLMNDHLISELEIMRTKGKNSLEYLNFSKYTNTALAAYLSKIQPYFNNEYDFSKPDSKVAISILTSYEAAVALFYDYEETHKSVGFVDDQLKRKMGITDDINSQIVTGLNQMYYLNEKPLSEKKKAFERLVRTSIKLTEEKVKEGIASSSKSRELGRAQAEKFANQSGYIIQLNAQKNGITVAQAKKDFLEEMTKKYTDMYSSSSQRIYSPDAYQAFEQELQAILDRGEIDPIRIQDYSKAYIKLMDKRLGDYEQFFKYSKSLKYRPNELMDFLDAYLSVKDAKKSSQSMDVARILKAHYIKSEVSPEMLSSQSDDKFSLNAWASIRNTMLSASLELYENHRRYQRFHSGSFLSLDEIISLKGGDFRASKFIQDVIGQEEVQAFSMFNDVIRKEKRAISEALLLSEADLVRKSINIDSVYRQSMLLAQFEKEWFNVLSRNAEIEHYLEEWSFEIDKLQKSLAIDEMFVDIERVEDESDDSLVDYLIFQVTRDRITPKVISNGKMLETVLYQKYRKEIFQGDPKGEDSRGFKNLKYDGEATDKSTYQAFWRDIVGDKAGVRKYFIYPDGIFHKINFNTLSSADTQNYVLDDKEIVVLNDVADFQYIKKGKEQRPSGAIHLYGRPQYYIEHIDQSSQELSSNGNYSRLFDADSEISDLPATQVEVEEIAKIGISSGLSVNKYLTDNASESQLKSSTGPEILHLATHGFFAESLKKTSVGSGYFSYETDKLINNPRLKCGLLLAGAGSALQGHQIGEEDGVLTGEEVMYLDLKNTELTVLSACETGLGEIHNGEGVMGLQRSFLIAGSKSVMMSLWEVDDEATRQLMSAFYSNWLNGGLDKRQALIAAQKEIKKSYPAPYYWGAFVILGK